MKMLSLGTGLLACGALWLSGGLVARGADCTPFTIPALDHGWYDSTGQHSPGNNNYLCGKSSGAPYRNWFVFQVPVLTQPVASAELRIYTSQISTPNTSEHYELRAVTTPAVTLRAGGVGLMGIYTDLGDGEFYGARTFLPGESYQHITIPLNTAFITNLTAASGGTMAVGGQLTTLDELVNTEYLFGSSGPGTLTNPSVRLLLTYSNFSTLSIVEEPASLSLLIGSPASFQVRVCGGGAPAYQWQWFGTNLPGATSPLLQLPSVTPAHSGPYQVIVTDSLTTVTSLVATLTVSNGISPTGSISMCYGQSPAQAGSTIGFCANIIGLPAPSYQWQFQGTNLPGQIGSACYLYDVQTNQSGLYRLVVTNYAGGFTSAPISLVVTQVAPSGGIYLAGGSVTPPAGSSVTLCSTIAGGPAPSLQWQLHGTNLPGQIGSCLSLFNLSSNQSGPYRLVASNVAGVFTSAPIAIAVQYVPPSGFVYFPGGQSSVPAGSYVTIYSSISAAPAPAYQWQLNGTNLPGQINGYLELFNVTSNQAGLYRLVANNVAGSFTSAPVVLTVNYSPPNGGIFFSGGGSPAPAGSSVTLCSAISGGPTPSLQWQLNGTNLPGQIYSCLGLYNLSTNEAGLYRLVASNSAGIFTSGPIALVVDYYAPTGSVYLSSGTLPATAGSTVTFCSYMQAAPWVSSYQWQRQGTNLPGQNGNCLNLFNVTSNEAGLYRVVASNSVGLGTSAPIALEVIYTAPTARIFLSSGHTPTVIGSSVNLGATVSGGPPPSLQWQFRGTNLAGETGSYLYLSNLQTNQSGPYTIVASNALGVVTSAVVIITVVEPQPVLAYLAFGIPPLQVGSFHYLVAETYLPSPLTLQWRFNGAAVPGATNSFFPLYPVTAASGGNYTVVATTTDSGSYTSAPVVVTTYYAPPTGATPSFSAGSSSALVGQDVVLFASYAGSPGLVQWRFNGANLPGQNDANLSLFGISTNQAGQYSFTVFNPAGATTSSVVNITVNYQAPVFVTDPGSLSLVEGATARFSSYASAGPLPQYFLERDGANVAVPYTFVGCCGLSAGGFSLFDTTPADAGLYRLIASNSLGMATSAVAVLTITPAGPLDRWTQRNPLPQSQPLLHVTHGPNLHVAVGERGTILTSPDGTGWTLQNRRADQSLRGAAYGNGVYVAVGDGGTILSSTDGANWSYRHSAPDTTLHAVTFAQGTFVAVGTAPGVGTLVMRSGNGRDWIKSGIGGQLAERSITHGRGRFVAVGSYSIMYSSDGITWSLAKNVTEEIEDIIYANHTFVAVGDEGTIHVSTDGISWMSIAPLTSRRLLGVSYGAGRFIAAGARGNMVSSEDGYSWSLISSGTPDRLETIDFSGSRFVAAGENGTIISSTNGTSWTKQSLGITRDLDGMHVQDGLMVIVGKGGSIITSTDGKDYTIRNSGVTNDLHGVTWGGDLWVAVGEPGALLTSPDAVTWTSHDSGTTNSLKDATFADGQWIVVGTQGTVVRSTDGANWSTSFTTPNYDLNDVAYGNGMFLIAADGPGNQDGACFRSNDGLIWNRVNVFFGKNLRGVIFANGLFLFTANDGLVFTTTTAVTFPITYLPAPFGYNGNLRAATWVDGLWVVVGNNGGIYTSPNLSTWTTRASRTFENQHQVAYINGTLVVIGNRGGVLQSGRFVTEVEPPIFQPGVGFQLPFKGVLKKTYQIQASSDFVNWTNLLTFTNLSEHTLFTDTNSLTQPHRFYRLLEQ